MGSRNSPLAARLGALAVLLGGCTSEYTLYEISNPSVCEHSCDVVLNNTQDNSTAYTEQLGFAVEIAAWGQSGLFNYTVDKNQRTVGAGAPYYVAAGVPGTGRVWMNRTNMGSGNLNTTAPTWLLNPPNASVRELGYALLASDVRSGRTLSIPQPNNAMELRPVAYGEEMLVGAPGSYDNVGAIEWYENQGSDQNGWQRGGELRPAGGLAGERFGAAIAAPHTLDARYPDDVSTQPPAWIAVGAPGRSRVYLYMVIPSAAQPFTLLQTINGPAGTGFGTRLAIADFNLDGMMDLAVGGPSASGGAGRVYLFTGQVGFTPVNPNSMVTLAPSGAAAAGGEFGFSLAAGFLRRNDGARPGLAVGAPGMDYNGSRDVGALCQYQFTGATGAPLQVAWQRCDRNPTPVADDRYAHAVAVGNFFGSNGTQGTTGSCAAGEEVAVGIPGEDHTSLLPAVINAGAVKIIPAGLDGAEVAASGGMVLWGTRSNQLFGRALAADFVQRTVHEDLAIGSPLYNGNRGSFSLSQARSPGGASDPLSGTWTSTDSGGQPFDVSVLWDSGAGTLTVTMLEDARMRATRNGQTCEVFFTPVDFTGTYEIGTLPWITTAATHTERIEIPVPPYGNVEADLTFNANTGRFTMNIDERAGILAGMNNDCAIIGDPFVFTRLAPNTCE
ncbi:MAG: FG-GAP repeat protein [Deltaproteobacteria bacterium]|nr:FG-GAP repeat protein [Deltaproteobacteria bacterium]